MYHFRVGSFGATSGESVSSGQSRRSSTPDDYITSTSVRSLPRNFRTTQHSKDLSLQRSFTEPFYRGENPEFHRSASGCLIERSRILGKGNKVNEALASELSSLYELSDFKNTALNKNGNFKIKATEYKGSPSVLTITPKEAAKIFEKRAQEYQSKNKGVDPLLSEQEKRKMEKLDDLKLRQVAYSSKPKESGGRSLTSNVHSRAPFSVKEQNFSSRSKSLSLPIDEENLDDRSRFRYHVCDHQDLVQQSFEVTSKSGKLCMNPSPQTLVNQAGDNTYVSHNGEDKLSNDTPFNLPALC